MFRLRISLPCALYRRIHGIWVRNGRPTYFEESEDDAEEEDEEEEDEDPPILVDKQPVIVAQARYLRPGELVPSGPHIVTAVPIPREVKALQPAFDRRPSYDAGRGLYLHEYEALPAWERKQSYDPGAPASRSGRATRDSSPA